MKILYKVKRNKDSPDERILRFTEMYLPDTERRRHQMISYNKQIMEPFSQHADEKARAKKRLLKENYKSCMKTHLQKAKFLPIN